MVRENGGSWLLPRIACSGVWKALDQGKEVNTERNAPELWFVFKVGQGRFMVSICDYFFQRPKTDPTVPE